MSQIDLNEIANNSNLCISITSNLEENPKDACIRRAKDVISFLTAIILLLCMLAFCGYIILSKDSSLDDKKWATALASSIISAFLGYLFGKTIR